MDFYPYDQTRTEYKKAIREMRLEKYIQKSTKMVDIDFSISVPSTSYFVAVNMLIEFNPTGQVVPTRIDILPYKLSPFSDFKEDNTSTIDVLKFILVLYTAYIVG
jgi:hypothetical protein